MFTRKTFEVLSLCLLGLFSFVHSPVAEAQSNVNVLVWNGIPDQTALFYGYLTLVGSHPLARGSIVSVLVPKGQLEWLLQAVSPLDEQMTLYGQFTNDPNLIQDTKDNFGKVLSPPWTDKITCSGTFPSNTGYLFVLLTEEASGTFSCSVSQ